MKETRTIENKKESPISTERKLPSASGDELKKKQDEIERQDEIEKQLLRQSSALGELNDATRELQLLGVQSRIALHSVLNNRTGESRPMVALMFSGAQRGAEEVDQFLLQQRANANTVAPGK
jgi:hypothetical protein